MHYATVNNCVEAVDALLAKGASVHEKDSLQKTPLHYAATNGYVEIVNALLTQGANVYEKDEQQKTPFYYAIINHQEDTVKDIKWFLKNKVVEDSMVVSSSVAVLGSVVSATLLVTETVESTLTSVATAIAMFVTTALASGYAKYAISKLNAEIKEIKERQNVIEEWQNVDLQEVYIHNVLS
ncbi:ankyrin repeat domain-containing protein [Wolbachia endosymbiont of Cylisticus convexus]|uniref:ankyrin repeat domain-containing protein n=1 Tax=Wolbachia endosymbiont of Cylisticus convexus TaxID=118728 RepID=UPI001F2126AA|nr:ankyrin repeat domain-containing protein [Wolbachia endosymbiont of Cylisticus convexus]